MITSSDLLTLYIKQATFGHNMAKPRYKSLILETLTFSGPIVKLSTMLLTKPVTLGQLVGVMLELPSSTNATSAF